MNKYSQAYFRKGLKYVNSIIKQLCYYKKKKKRTLRELNHILILKVALKNDAFF